jgi:HAD superfamily hydrolase (TIGR01509 family)
VQSLDFDAVLFDMDGTLIDTEPYWISAETALVEQHGGQWSPEQGLALVGSGLWGTADALIHAGVEMEPRALIDWLSSEVRRQMDIAMPWRPGVVDMVTALLDQGISLALVTMSFRDNALHLKEALETTLHRPVFPVVVSGEDVTFPKPHPEAYQTAAESLGVAIQRCVAFEDSAFGAASAFSAGAFTIGIPLHVDIPDTYVHSYWDSMAGKSPLDIQGELSARGGR